MGCKFHHVALKVKDFDTTVKFYKDVLNLKEKVAWDMDGTPAVMLEMAGGGIVEIFGNGPDAEEVNTRWVHLAVSVDDVPGTYKKALECGAKNHREPGEASIPGDKPMNIEIAFVQCPGGEILEFFKVK